MAFTICPERRRLLDEYARVVEELVKLGRSLTTGAADRARYNTVRHQCVALRKQLDEHSRAHGCGAELARGSSADGDQAVAARSSATTRPSKSLMVRSA